ncbi:MAG: SPOR domain-containing protein, partial [Deltaproteobacteria bacterium HGW-Deltaproteobacteria-14]
AAPAEAAAPTPTLKVDFAGLLGQLFKLAPHGLATKRPSAEQPAATPAAEPGPPAGAVGEDAAPREGGEPEE